MTFEKARRSATRPNFVLSLEPLFHTHACTCEKCYQVRNTNKSEKNVRATRCSVFNQVYMECTQREATNRRRHDQNQDRDGSKNHNVKCGTSVQEETDSQHQNSYILKFRHERATQNDLRSDTVNWHSICVADDHQLKTRDFEVAGLCRNACTQNRST